jgi:hypothetical protein
MIFGAPDRGSNRNQSTASHLKHRQTGDPLPVRGVANVIGVLQRGQDGI